MTAAAAAAALSLALLPEAKPASLVLENTEKENLEI
jgi:hypothetical protein